ncbi:unnamed protein product [Clonostachys rosea f. rosea IK726]|uniref:Uncharacterized protein n=2 Tax=Bionectria ochroleuca TaxID=29856 RepID=A0A0B7JRX7_BIOOC|nr:unnamed protein product [Clonostachys rosea f. rosea IK726]
MSEFTINDGDFANLRGQTVVVTGSSSGIGLQTAKLLLDIGAFVVAGDLNPVPIEHENIAFRQTNITIWDDLLGLFELAESKHGKVDHVFANAGVAPKALFVEDEVDENGKPVPPNLSVVDVNLKGTIYTVTMGLHFLKKQKKGSIVITASASSFQRFGCTDYGVAKHGVLGLIRGLHLNLKVLNPAIRINGIAPNWTETGIATQRITEAIGAKLQGTDVPARSAAILMADESRKGQLIFSVHGRLIEVEEALLLKSVNEGLIREYLPEEEFAFDKLADVYLSRLPKKWS